MTFTLEPITVDDDFAFRYAVYVATIKPYLNEMLDWSDDEHEARLYENMRDGGGHCALVVDGERVGVVLIHESPSAIALEQIEILPEYQGRGIGTAVIATVQAQAEHARKPLELSVFPANTGARALYVRCGFSVVEVAADRIRMVYLPPSLTVPDNAAT